MINKLKTIFSLLILTSSLIFSSCTKEGPVGPAGKDGNANVVSSTLTNVSWDEDGNTWVINLTYPAITQEIINSGAVLVYIGGNNSYTQLPFTIYSSDEYSTSFNYAVSVGSIQIECSDSDLILPQQPGNVNIKVVVIASSQKHLIQDTDVSNYNEIKDALNLPN